MPPRRRSSAVVFVLALAAAPAAVHAQAETPAPAAASCAQPDAPARMLHAAHAVVPPEAMRYGVGGQVIVDVNLDAAGRVEAARARTWSSHFFVRSALAAARASTYAAAVHGCAPVPSTAEYEASYAVPEARPRDAVDALAYLPGTWRCRTASGSITQTIVVERTGRGFAWDTGGAVTSISQDAYRMWRIRSNGQDIGWAYPWTGNDWTWAHHGSTAPMVRIRKLDQTTFALSAFPSGHPHQPTEGRCVRVGTAP